MAGFQITLGWGCCQPSQDKKLPFFIRMLLSASIGMVCRADHCPSGTLPGTTEFEGAEGGPVPMVLVAVTTNV